ncbi:hypothetical protein P3T23_009406 [Paraburkholderia sp. GAS448]|uniref:hypothetical protein n=1 Tax=Paraburkholderia sp. GAS448 TaxID=3035136 RepID=UPI003D2260BE
MLSGKMLTTCLMSPREARESRENIAGFFSAGRAHNVERLINTVEGPRVFLFKNSLVSHATGAEDQFLVCSGVEVPSDTANRDTEDDRVGEDFENQILKIMDRVMNWEALVNGVRTLLNCYEQGDMDLKAVAHARRIASQALTDACVLHEELDAMLLSKEVSGGK